MYLFHVSTRSERHGAHHQEMELYYYIVWYD